MISEIDKINIIKPKKSIGIKSVGISCPQGIKVDDFILLQEILSPEELREIIRTHASVTIKNNKNELLTFRFSGIQDYIKSNYDNEIEIVAVNLSKTVLKKIALEHNIWDYRLIVSGFDPYIKLRNKENLRNNLIDALMGTKPDPSIEDYQPKALHNAMVKHFSTSNLYIMSRKENIIDMMRKAYNSLRTRISIEENNLSEVIISTLTPYNVYKGAKGILCSSKYGEIDNRLSMIPVMELREGCIGYLQLIKIASLLSAEINVSNILGITGDTLASISGSDWKCRGLSSDTATATLFGECEKGYGILGVSNFNIPRLHNIITEDQLAGGLLMNGQAISKVITECYPILVRHAIKAFGFDRSRVKIISHQMNGTIISKLHHILNNKRLPGEMEICEEQIINTFGQYGNSSSSTIPTALYQTLVDSKLRKGDEVLFVALGAGFNMGYVGYRVNGELIECYS